MLVVVVGGGRWRGEGSKAAAAVLQLQKRTNWWGVGGECGAPQSAGAASLDWQEDAAREL